jgi:hypothetical protein
VVSKKKSDRGAYKALIFKGMSSVEPFLSSWGMFGPRSFSHGQGNEGFSPDGASV